MTDPAAGPSRRHFLRWTAAGGAGALGGAGLATVVAEHGGAAAPERVRTISPYGPHQPGITTPTAPAIRLVALDLLPGTDGPGLARLMRLWSGDIAAAGSGRAAPGDPAPDLAQAALGLTVTVGWGADLFDRVGLAAARPKGLTPVPAMRHDRLEPRWCGGDLLVIVSAGDDTSVQHVLRRLLADAAPFARWRWEQSGGWRGTDADGRPVTGRNLFGQVDGSGNDAVGSERFARTVWAEDPDWFAGGTTVVMRRIAMDLDGWEELTRHEQERVVGRDLTHGAPLTGSREHDPLDLAAKDARGRPVIALGAHSRLAHPSQNGGARIFRKGANYTVVEDGKRQAGLIFLSHQADIARQFVPLQQRLDAHDELNTWTTAIGSAEFALLPGFSADGWLGDRLLA